MKEKLAGGIQVGTLQGPGNLGVSGGNAPSQLTGVLTTVIGFLTGIAFIYFTIQVFLGALSWITAGGDKGKVEQARSKITSGIQGVVVVIAALFIIELVGIIFGIDFLDVEGMITTLGGP